MPTTYSIPLGPLSSFTVPGVAAFTFDQRHSKLLPGWHMGEGQPSVGLVPGQATAVDRWGKTRTPITFDLTWEYMIISPLGSSDLTVMQTQLDTLTTLRMTNAVGFLVVLRSGGGVPVSGNARLVDISNVGQGLTFMQLNLRFFVPGGFS